MWFFFFWLCVCLFNTIFSYILLKRFKAMKKQIDHVEDYVFYLLENETSPADTGGVDDLRSSY